MESLCLKTGIHAISPGISGEARVNALRASTVAVAPRQKKGLSPRLSFSFRYPLQSLRTGGGKNKYNDIALDDAVLVQNGERENFTAVGPTGDENWFLKILHVRYLRRKVGAKSSKLDSDGAKIDENFGGDVMNGDDDNDEEEGCDGCRVSYEAEEEGFELDREIFSRLLRKVSLVEAKLYAQMSYLGTLSYCIPKIKPVNLLKFHGFRFVTSSIEKRNLATKTEKNEVSAEDQVEGSQISKAQINEQKKINGYRVPASVAYDIAASAAAYLHSHTKSILPFRSSNSGASEDSPEGDNGNFCVVDMMNPQVASLMATTDSVTAVVAAKEEVKQAVADDLSSSRSSPCEWFICDDHRGTRFFVIQGSESLASWQANLLFEPVQFEGLDVLVHRGIYEAAKGIYARMLPEVHAHLKSRGSHTTFRFTGHSLGGSLSLLINLMLLIRGEVPASSLLPVITFGSPSVMCGGDRLLSILRLPRSHVQAITMHRDIVPRAFSCDYPNRVAEILKAVNGSFKNHPCLNNKKLLYSPMGELLILQPDEKSSPHHHLLPSGVGLYFLCPLSDTGDAEKQLWVAQTMFLNSPHPLEILSDRSAYGTEGTIQRDHDMNLYLRSVRNVIRQELNRIKKAKREHQRKLWWPLAALRSNNGGSESGGRKSLRRLSNFFASQRYLHLLVVLLFPARMFFLGAYDRITSG